VFVHYIPYLFEATNIIDICSRVDYGRTATCLRNTHLDSFPFPLLSQAVHRRALHKYLVSSSIPVKALIRTQR